MSLSPEVRADVFASMRVGCFAAGRVRYPNDLSECLMSPVDNDVAADLSGAEPPDTSGRIGDEAEPHDGADVRDCGDIDARQRGGAEDSTRSTLSASTGDAAEGIASMPPASLADGLSDVDEPVHGHGPVQPGVQVRGAADASPAQPLVSNEFEPGTPASLSASTEVRDGPDGALQDIDDDRSAPPLASEESPSGTDLREGVGDGLEATDTPERDRAAHDSRGADAPPLSAPLEDLEHLLEPTGTRITEASKGLAGRVLTTPTTEYVEQFRALSSGIHVRGAVPRPDVAFAHAGEPTLPHAYPRGEVLANRERRELGLADFSDPKRTPVPASPDPEARGDGVAADGCPGDGGSSGAGDTVADLSAGSDSGAGADDGPAVGAAPADPECVPDGSTPSSTAHAPVNLDGFPVAPPAGAPAEHGREACGPPAADSADRTGVDPARERGDAGEPVDPGLSLHSDEGWTTRERLDSGLMSGAHVHRESSALARALGPVANSSASLEVPPSPSPGVPADDVRGLLREHGSQVPVRARGAAPNSSAPLEVPAPDPGPARHSSSSVEPRPASDPGVSAGAVRRLVLDSVSPGPVCDREDIPASRLEADRKAFHDEWVRSGDREIQDDLGQPQTGLPRPPPQVLSEHARVFGDGATDTRCGPERDAGVEAPTGRSGGGIEHGSAAPGAQVSGAGDGSPQLLPAPEFASPAPAPPPSAAELRAVLDFYAGGVDDGPRPRPDQSDPSSD